MLACSLLFCFAGDVQCFGSDCYALAFGVPAVLMIIALCEYHTHTHTHTHTHSHTYTHTHKANLAKYCFVNSFDKPPHVSVYTFYQLPVAHFKLHDSLI